jgi:hypothetical protein
MNKIEIDLKALPVDVRAWVEFEIMSSNAHDIAVHIQRKKQVRMDGVMVSGFFCSHTDRLFVAGLSKDWVPIMVHETCHRDQYTEQAKVWNQTIQINGENHDPLTIFHEWLEHKTELGPRKTKEMLQGCLNLELDCEKRSAKKIDQFYLPINLKEYIQKANAYVYFYLAMQHTRCWYPKGKAPFALPEVWTKMPADFDNDYTKLPKRIKDLILKHSYNKRT